jgi:lysophospholipase L1-like esterase
LLLIGSALFGVAIVECGARLAGWGDVVLFVPDQDWGFLMKPSQMVSTYGHPVQINSLGLRGPELQSPKPHGTTRIVFIGDSVTYGGGRIPEKDLFCRQVEARARDEGNRVEAVNVSAPAWSPQNWWAYIQQHGLYDADIVVLTLPECDLTRYFSTMSMGGHADHAPPLRIQSLANKVLAQFGREKLTARQRMEEVIEANLNAVIGLREKCKDTRLVVTLVPSGVPCQPNEALWSKFLPHLSDTLDLRMELQNPAMFMDGAHLSVSGHAFVGEKLYEKLRSSLKGPVAAEL